MQASQPTGLRVEDMTCNNCARQVVEAIQSVPGVASATVSLRQQTAAVRWQTGVAGDLPAVLAAIQRSGFHAVALDLSGQAAPGNAAGRRPWTLMLGLAVTGGLMAGEWGLGLGLRPWFEWTAFVLAGAVQAAGGAAFYRGAWRQLQAGSSNMDTLVALGSTTAFGYSAWALITGAVGQLYFMESAAIISLITLGHQVEARVSERAGSALRALLTLAPATARKIAAPGPKPVAGALDLRNVTFAAGVTGGRPAEAEIETPVAALRRGDRIVLLPGDRVPVDGRVLAGNSAVDESMVTGEPMPVEKQAGMEVFTGTLNEDGRLVVEVTATGMDTALAQVIASVERAQTSRARIQRLGDRVSNVFVPVVSLVALVSGLVWGLAPHAAGQAHAWLARWLWSAQPPAGAGAGFIIAAGVLIVACPCAMGLATPAAIMAAANAAARRGILIRDGLALEKAGRVTVVVFDKTGTLTRGRPEVVAEQALGLEPAVVQALAAGLARHSTHPVSRRLAALASEPVNLGDWREIRGSGLAAESAERGALRLGSLAWLEENGADLAAGRPFIAEWSGQGATVVGLTVAGRLAGLFALQDTLKPDAIRVVAELKRQKLRVCLATGDQPATAAAIARQAGIAPENILAGARPEAKAEFVRALQAGGARVAFAGDGINDAPALSQADLGIAVSRASDVAREAADIILLKSEVGAVPECLQLARDTLRTIRQNLFWAFVYNAAGVPLAALGFISPVVCAVAMGASDLLVIGNALRLLRRPGRRGMI